VIPRDQTVIIVEHELIATAAWGEHHNIEFTWLSEELVLRVMLTQPETAASFFLAGHFSDYKELPPFWNFCASNWLSSDSKNVFPKPKTTDNMPNSIFIAHGQGAVICVPFNRLAFGAHKGPHTDWTDPAQWQTYAPDRAHAITIADMLNIIWMHFLATKGRMSDVG